MGPVPGGGVDRPPQQGPELVARGSGQRPDYGQRVGALHQVVACWLAQPLVGGHYVQEVVDHLEGHAVVVAEAGECVDDVAGVVGHDGSNAGRGGQQGGGLAGDRDTALAQAGAECLRQAGVTGVRADRTLPYIFAFHLQEAGIALNYDPEMGVRERRVKDEEELENLRAVQAVTEDAMQMACSLIARAPADADGVLQYDGLPLTSERVRQLISRFVLDHDCTTLHDSIVVTIPHVADCHQRAAKEAMVGVCTDRSGYGGRKCGQYQ